MILQLFTVAMGYLISLIKKEQDCFNGALTGFYSCMTFCFEGALFLAQHTIW